MNNIKRIFALALALCLLLGCVGCGSAPQAQDEQPSDDQTSAAQPEQAINEAPEEDEAYTNYIVMEEADFEAEAVALGASPGAFPTVLMPEASGTAKQENDKAVIDYSNIADGYVMTKFTAQTQKRLKVQVAGPTTTYTYNLTAGAWTTFPLSDGNGNYKVTVLENTTDTKYAVVVSASFTVALKDEFEPFIRPNQYVDYSVANNTMSKAAELTAGVTDPLAKVEKVYSFVVDNLTYDKEKAETVKSGYLPVLDDVLAAKKGICFDYAALMAGMLRSVGVPCKLVVGYAGSVYHAWISVWTEEAGWIDGVIFFDGTTWQRMDPTFASSSNSSDAIMKYIGDGSNYTVKYLY